MGRAADHQVYQQKYTVYAKPDNVYSAFCIRCYFRCGDGWSNGVLSEKIQPCGSDKGKGVRKMNIKRMLKEKQETFDYANAALLGDLLESLDNFDRTIEAAKDATDPKSIASPVLCSLLRGP